MQVLMSMNKFQQNLNSNFLLRLDINHVPQNFTAAPSQNTMTMVLNQQLPESYQGQQSLTLRFF